MSKNKKQSGASAAAVTNQAATKAGQPAPQRRDFAAQFRAARYVGTPIISVQTADAFATIQRLMLISDERTPLIQWDGVAGFSIVVRPHETDAERSRLNQASMQALGLLEGTGIINPVNALTMAADLPGKSPNCRGTILFIHSAHKFLQEERDYAQAILRLRDGFKGNNRMLVLLAPSFSLPPELTQHVLMLDEPLPTPAELDEIITTTTETLQVTLTEAERSRARDAVLGLAAFPAEQALYMSRSADKQTLDLSALWERKQQMIQATPGLSVWQGSETFSDIGGCEQVKKFNRAILHKVRGIVFVDELEKAVGHNQAGDSSGVKQGMLGTLLSEMQDRRYIGQIYVGVPGAAKSALVKAMGAEGNIPVIVFDLTGMQDSLVGASEARLRHALKVVHAVTDGAAMFVATSNNIAGLPPELLRRFSLGTWFFDLPTAEERKLIWAIHLRKFNLSETPQAAGVNDNNWTGAEIENCCRIAEMTGLGLAEAAEFIVPVAKSGAEKVAALRQQASGRYLSAAQPGPYMFAAAPQMAPAAGGARMIENTI